MTQRLLVSKYCIHLKQFFFNCVFFLIFSLSAVSCHFTLTTFKWRPRHANTLKPFKSCQEGLMCSPIHLNSLSDLSLTLYHVQTTGSTCKVEIRLRTLSWKPTFRIVWICCKSAPYGYSRNIFCLLRFHVQAIFCCWNFLTSEGEFQHLTLNLEA